MQRRDTKDAIKEHYVRTVNHWIYAPGFRMDHPGINDFDTDDWPEIQAFFKTRRFVIYVSFII